MGPVTEPEPEREKERSWKSGCRDGPSELPPLRWRPDARVKGPLDAPSGDSGWSPRRVLPPRRTTSVVSSQDADSAVRLERRSAFTGNVARQPVLPTQGDLDRRADSSQEHSKPDFSGKKEESDSEGQPAFAGPQTSPTLRGRAAGGPSDQEQQRNPSPREDRAGKG